ncbi:carboxypeptidase-like regulatory domain-containing protein [Nocardia sp. NPDC050717]|uniref:carboxypeptidase-like regulatory domain-containing protein n=1 Tax=Nocardia sp. NPDC050717 TaxID=3157221 RepID=UPI003403BB9C
MIAVATAAFTAAAVGAAAAHPGGADTVEQTSPCEARQSRHDDLYLGAPDASATGQIDAVLIESDSRTPIAGGKVVLTGDDVCGDTIHRHLSTGADGQASFRGLQPGRYRLIAYRSATAARSISAADVELTVPARKTLQFTAATGRD